MRALCVGLTICLGNLLTGCGSQSSRASRELAAMHAGEFYTSPIQVKFMNAVARGDRGEMSDLLNSGASVNAQGVKGMTPLFWAIAKDSLQGFEYVLERGGKPNAVVQRRTKAGPLETLSVMRLAAMAEDPRFLSLALKAGGDANAVAYGTHTLLYVAILHSRSRNVELLAEAGADLDHQDGAGITPVMFAAYMNKYELVWKLLQRGANPELRTRSGINLADIVRRYGNAGRMSAADQRSLLNTQTFLSEKNRIH